LRLSTPRLSVCLGTAAAGCVKAYCRNIKKFLYNEFVQLLLQRSAAAITLKLLELLLTCFASDETPQTADQVTVLQLLMYVD
jgi:hypothetical protein